MSEERYLAAVDKLYAAALDPGAWTAALDAVSRLLDSWSSHYFLWDPAASTTAFSVISEHIPAKDEQAYIDHYGAIDPRRQLLAERNDGKWMLCHEHFDERYVSKSEFYQDFLIPAGGRYVAGLQLAQAHGLAAVLGIMRAPGSRPYGQDERRWLERLRPELQRASRFHLELHRLRLHGSLLQQTLDAVDRAVLVADATGSVLLANRAGEAWLAENGVVVSRSGRLGSPRPAFDEKLRRLLSDATRGRNGARIGGASAIYRTGESNPHQLLVLPLRPDARLAETWQRPLALLIVVDPNAGASVGLDKLQALFGLTLAEARVAAALAEGRSLKEFAQSSDLSEHTAKAQLKAALEKTGTRRQAQLVRAVLSLPRVKDDSG
jgi:DNA-binding CsgD family transcriptional regulator